MRNHDQRRPALPARLTSAEREFFVMLRQLVDTSGLSLHALAEVTSQPGPEPGESPAPAEYTAVQWGDWLNGHSLPPRKAVRRFAESLAKADADAGNLVELWALAFMPTPYPQEPGGALVRPRQLPMAASHFMGRTAELKTLGGLSARATAGDSPVIVVIEGAAGVGKTALATQLAHAIAGRFPDGQLYASMHGYDNAGLDDASEPTPDREVLRGFLEAFGVPPRDLPSEADDQAAMYQRLLAGRRVLVVLDNARDASQVRRLLPRGKGSMAVVTSRGQLARQLGAGTQVLGLGPLTESESRELLEGRIGAARVRREPRATSRLLELCGRLPLALGLVAAWVAARPDVPLDVLAGKLGEHSPDLRGSDPDSTARTAFAHSYHQLSEPAARLFRLLSVHPGPDVSQPAAASLAAIPVEQARKALDELAKAYLVEEHLPGRFACHDLLRVYAAERARASEPAAELDTALRRLLDHYLRSIVTAVSLAYPPALAVPVPAPRSGVLPEGFESGDQARAWCHAELPVVASLVARAAERGLDAYCWQIPSAMAPFKWRSGLLHHFLGSQRVALAAAGRLQDPLGLGHAHYHFAHACALLGEVADSDRHLQDALRSFTLADDQASAARTLNGMAQLLMQQGEYHKALDREKEALSLRLDLGDRDAVAHSEETIGSIYSRLGEYDQALRHCHRSLDLSRETGARLLAADALSTLGFINLALGQPRRAIASYMEVLAIYRQAGEKASIVAALTGLGDAQQAADDDAAARASWQQALALLKDQPNADDQPVRARLARLLAPG
jgi:tetratricopeptide (TPR) repeat protein